MIITLAIHSKKSKYLLVRVNYGQIQPLDLSTFDPNICLWQVQTCLDGCVYGL